MQPQQWPANFDMVYRGDQKGESEWGEFVAFATNLMKDLGFIFIPPIPPKRSGKWKAFSKGVRVGVTYSHAQLRIGKKVRDRDWNLFDGNHDELPWEFLTWDDEDHDLKPIVEDNGTRVEDWVARGRARHGGFHNILRQATLKVTRFDDGYSFEFEFRPHLFGYEDTFDMMDFEIRLSRHERLPLKHLTPKCPETEVKRAIAIAKKRVKALQNKLGERFDLHVCEHYDD